jgi:hypothetical protein
MQYVYVYILIFKGLSLKKLGIGLAPNLWNNPFDCFGGS